jgi:hypothetical protein
MKTHASRTWLLYLAVIFSTGIILVSCQKENAALPDEQNVFPDPSTLPQGLIGTWIETNTLTDTLVFNSSDDSGLVFLQRGFEISNGYYLPVIGSDAYFYQIENNSIHMKAGLSSLGVGESFYYSFDDKNLIITIGKFCKYIDTGESVLTFRKIR